VRSVVRVYPGPPAENDAGWSSQVARWAHNPKVAGSNPVPATKFDRFGFTVGDVAQLAERLICIQEVAGSTPVISTKVYKAV
jgi:hypothetical protein